MLLNNMAYDKGGMMNAFTSVSTSLQACFNPDQPDEAINLKDVEEDDSEDENEDEDEQPRRGSKKRKQAKGPKEKKLREKKPKEKKPREKKPNAVPRARRPPSPVVPDGAAGPVDGSANSSVRIPLKVDTDKQSAVRPKPQRKKRNPPAAMDKAEGKAPSGDAMIAQGSPPAESAAGSDPGHVPVPVPISSSSTPSVTNPAESPAGCELPPPTVSQTAAVRTGSGVLTPGGIPFTSASSPGVITPSPGLPTPTPIRPEVLASTLTDIPAEPSAVPTPLSDSSRIQESSGTASVATSSDSLHCPPLQASDHASGEANNADIEFFQPDSFDSDDTPSDDGPKITLSNPFSVSNDTTTSFDDVFNFGDSSGPGTDESE